MGGAMGNVLKAELKRIGVSIKACRVTSLWLHEPNGNEECLKYGQEQVVKEAQGKLVVLLLGSETCEFFLNKKVSQVAGIPMKSPYFDGVALPSMNPAIVFHAGVGEIRLVMNRLEEILDGFDN